MLSVPSSSSKQTIVEQAELPLSSMAKIPSASTTAETTATIAHRKMALRPRSMVSMKERGTAKRPKIGTAKKKSSKLDGDKPKKPPTAFFYFLEDFRKEFQEQNPDVKSMREIGKACGEKWKTMTYEEKVQYYDVATEQRAKFEKALADYAKRKENGEHDEFEEDSDSDYDE
ncbi:putative chromatin remodeling & transcriptional activation HMG family [Helianthus annuus]|nr:putative chromatin remodeling & transcriptional activation HMG family [Helianthus annuus]